MSEIETPRSTERPADAVAAYKLEREANGFGRLTVEQALAEAYPATDTDSDLWALRTRVSDAAQRVRTDPDPTRPAWRAALAELTHLLAIAEQADPVYRQAVAEVEEEGDEWDEPTVGDAGTGHGAYEYRSGY